MIESLTQDEIDRLPKDGIDYQDFILYLASKNNWVFDLSEYSTAIVNAQKGALGRVSTTLKELEGDDIVIKQRDRKIYSVTTKGIKYYKTGNIEKDINVQTQINATNVVFTNGDSNAPILLANDHSSSENQYNTPPNKPEKTIIQMLFSKKSIVAIIISVIAGIILLLL